MTKMKHTTAIATAAIMASAGFAGAELEYFDLGRGDIPIYVPSTYDPDKPMPLVLMLHGYTVTGEEQEAYFQFQPLAESYGFLYTYPTGMRDNLGHPYWNAFGLHAGPVPDDSAYLRDVMEYVQANYAVASRRIYVIGHSMGSGMAMQMACEHADLIAAVMGLASPIPAGAVCSFGGPVHVLAIHGTEDSTVPYGGGCSPPPLTVCFPSAPQAAEDWAERNGCLLEPDLTAQPLDLDASIPGAETTVAGYEAGCAPGGSSHLWTIEGGGHIPGLTSDFRHLVVEFLLDHLDWCTADFNEDGVTDLFDFLAFQNAFAAGDLRADCDGDTSLTFFDLLCFQNEFASGCK